MSEENPRIRRALAEIAEQDKIISQAEVAKMKAQARKNDLHGFIRIEREQAAFDEKVAAIRQS